MAATAATPDIHLVSDSDRASMIRDYLLPSIISEHWITRSVIHSVPADRLDFKLSPASMTVSQLMWYTVATDHFYLTGIIEARIPAPAATPDERGAEAVLAWDDQHFSRNCERLAQLSGEDLLRQVEVFGQTKPVVEFLPLCLTVGAQNRAMLLAALSAPATQTEAVDPAPAPASEASELSEAELAGVAGGGDGFIEINVVSGGPRYAPQLNTSTTLGSLWSTDDPTIKRVQGALVGAAFAATAIVGGAVLGGAAAAGEIAASSAVATFEAGAAAAAAGGTVAGTVGATAGGYAAAQTAFMSFFLPGLAFGAGGAATTGAYLGGTAKK